MSNLKSLTKTFTVGNTMLVEVVEYFQGMGIDISGGSFTIKFRFPDPEYPDDMETDVTYEFPES